MAQQAVPVTTEETVANLDGKINFGENLFFFLANLGNIPIQVAISSFLLFDRCNPAEHDRHSPVAGWLARKIDRLRPV